MELNQERTESLKEYVTGLLNRENGGELYLRYKDAMEGATPHEVFEVFHSVYRDGADLQEILGILNKVIHVLYKSLAAYQWERPAEAIFLIHLDQENQALKERLARISKVIQESGYPKAKAQLLVEFRELKVFNAHYLKKENILFPYLERRAKRFDGLAIMWAMHDQARDSLKKVIQCLESAEEQTSEFNVLVGSLFFDLHGLIQKEELILFPAASEIIVENEWHAMALQSEEYEFPLIQRPDFGSKRSVQSQTGMLDLDQLLMLFDALPVDLTFVDENDKVRFFSRPKDRIFPRSPAILGRDVEKCHPPQSVHIVREIVASFRSGAQDTAKFWIDLHGKKILIQYFALRDQDGRFRGTLEVSQDITEIQGLEGQRRLLDW